MRVFVLFSVLLACYDVIGANYYVDYVGGSDANNGTSTATPWKHSPGDANATGTAASTLLLAGDIVNFKLGVSYNGSLTINRNGSAGSPIIYTAATGWGTGTAILEGTVGGVTNNNAVTINGNYVTVQNLTIQDYTNAMNPIAGNNVVISNNVIHHMGTFPYDTSMGSSQGGYGIYGSQCTGLTVVSNKFYDLNYNAVGGNLITNGIVWGNELYAIQNHGMQFWSYGWTLVAYNFIHDETNVVNHSDAMQTLGQPVNTTNILCFNTFSNNIDNMNVQPFFSPIGNTNVSGYFYVFDNLTMNSQPGVGGESGNSNGSECDTYGNMQSIWVFNNTFVDHNAGWGGYRTPTFRDTSLTITNGYLANNIFYNSLGGWNDGYTNGLIKTIYTGYNLFTNFYRSGVMMQNDTNAGNNLVTLATYQADMSAEKLEQNSIYAQVTFASYALNGSGIQTAGDFHLAIGSAGITQGTNLTLLFPASSFGFLPAAYVVDPTKDIAGTQRSGSARWDIGAYAYVSDPTITVQPSNQTVNLGQTATFTVTATGTAPITYYWYKQGSLIQAGASSSYTTSATTCAYNGNLAYVVVSNSVGMVTSSTASLTVNGCQGTATNYVSQIGTANIGAARF